MADRRDLGDVLDFMRLFWELDHVLHRRSKRMERTIGVTGVQRLVVRVVGSAPGVSAGELADSLRLHPSTLTEVLKRMVAKGLIERRQDPEDGRKTLLRLTARGHAVDRNKEGTVEELVAAVIRRTPAEHLAIVRAVVTALIAEGSLPAEEAVKARPARRAARRRQRSG
jgi:DNA-binding MarR family transcriptional regulator